jgi:hypothetical protein
VTFQDVTRPADFPKNWRHYSQISDPVKVVLHPGKCSSSTHCHNYEVDPAASAILITSHWAFRGQSPFSRHQSVKSRPTADCPDVCQERYLVPCLADWRTRPPSKYVSSCALAHRRDEEREFPSLSSRRMLAMLHGFPSSEAAGSS